MRRFGLLFTLNAFLLVDFPRNANGDTPPAPRVDAHGDPLPDHAVDRLGSKRAFVTISTRGTSSIPRTVSCWRRGSTNRNRFTCGMQKAVKACTDSLQPDGAVYPKIAFTSDSKHFGGYHSVWDLKTGNEVLNLGGDFGLSPRMTPGSRVSNRQQGPDWDLPNRKKLRDFPGVFRAFSKDGNA